MTVFGSTPAPAREASPTVLPIAVVAALREELAPLLARAVIVRRDDRAGVRILQGSIGGTPVVLASTGVGSLRAERGLSRLLEHVPVERLVIVGVSGAITPGLSPATLVVGRRVFDGLVPSAPPDGAWVERAITQGALCGTVVSTPKILRGPSAKAATRAGLAAVALDDGPAAVDLESAAYARVAARYGLPYLVVRAICDTAEETLPFDFDEFRGRDGGLRRSQVVLHALAHPSTLGSLWELRGRLRRGSERLASLVESLLRKPAA